MREVVHMNTHVDIGGVRFNFVEYTKVIRENEEMMDVLEWLFETPSGDRKVRVKFFDGLVELETKDVRKRCAMWKSLGIFLQNRRKEEYSPLFRKLSGISMKRVKRKYMKESRLYWNS